MVMRKTILIVEDNQEEASFLTRALSPLYQLHVIANGAEALAFVRSGHDFDLILMDIRMPGMSGDRVLKGLRQLGDATEVLILTAFDASDLAISTLHDGAFEYLTKPITRDRLLLKVSQALESGELKKSETIELQYQNRRNHFKRNFVHSIGQTIADEEFDDYSTHHDAFIDRLSRRRIR